MGVEVDEKKCIGCAGCVSVCPVAALKLNGKYPECNFNECIDCGACVRFCPVGALSLKEKKNERGI